MYIWIWGTVSAGYIAFLAWYFNWTGPLTKAEVDQYIDALSANTGSAHTDTQVIREFLEQDDGREFLMQNLVRFHDGSISHPATGELTNPREVLKGYFGPFSRALFKRAGHPVIASRKVGGYVDSWETPADPGWHLSSLMRYRSRRDMMELVIDPQFSDMHKFKTAAIQQTASFPTQTALSFYLSPKFFIPLLLLFLTSLAHNILSFLSV